MLVRVNTGHYLVERIGLDHLTAMMAATCLPRSVLFANLSKMSNMDTNEIIHYIKNSRCYCRRWVLESCYITMGLIWLPLFLNIFQKILLSSSKKKKKKSNTQPINTHMAM